MNQLGTILYNLVYGIQIKYDEYYNVLVPENLSQSCRSLLLMLFEESNDIEDEENERMLKMALESSFLKDVKWIDNKVKPIFRPSELTEELLNNS